MNSMFRVGITRDFLKEDGSLGFGDIGLSLLDDDAGVDWEFLAKKTSEITPDVAREFDALLVLTPQVTSATLDDGTRCRT